MSIFSLLALALAVQPAPAASSSEPAPLSLEQKTQVKCAAAFAVVTYGQNQGEQWALAYPSLEKRGLEYFADTGQQLVAQTGRSQGEVGELIVAQVKAFQTAAQNSADPNGTIDAVMTPCLSLLDAQVPPSPQPSLPQCAAILALAYEEVYAREGLSSNAKDLKTLAGVLESRARGMLREEGRSGTQIDVILGTLKADLAAQAKALEAQGQTPNLDYEYCFELAEP